MKILKRRVKQNLQGRLEGSNGYKIGAVQAKVVTNIKKGYRFAMACQAAGISRSTGYDWLALGEGRIEGIEPSEAHIAFARAVRDAEDALEGELVELWKGHATKDWRAARDFLAKRFGKAWGKDETENAIEFPPQKPWLYWDEEERDVEDVDENDYSWQAALEAKREAQRARIEAEVAVEAEEQGQIEGGERALLTAGEATEEDGSTPDEPATRIEVRYSPDM